MGTISLGYEPKPRRYHYFRSSILVIHTIAWTTPVEDAWKLNFSACAPNGLRHGGAGYVLREHHGIFKAARAEPLPNDFSHIEAKLVALNLGLQEAVVQGIDYLEVEGHSPYAMELVIDDEAPLAPSIRPIVHKCRKLLRQFKLVKFHPVAAYANRAAAKIAEMATNETEIQRWTMEPPDEIAKILVDDMTGYWESIYN
ncbi:Ribonuclease H-like domain containing [Olea europaea subsp. europaea]|nr:Ribonuclease H-like domain containing [Olea europaea subsp. europaea]